MTLVAVNIYNEKNFVNIGWIKNYEKGVKKGDLISFTGRYFEEVYKRKLYELIELSRYSEKNNNFEIKEKNKEKKEEFLKRKFEVLDVIKQGDFIKKIR